MGSKIQSTLLSNTLSAMFTAAMSCYTMFFFLIFRLCNCIVCVLVFPGDSIAGRVVEGERGTLGSRSQRHAG